MPEEAWRLSDTVSMRTEPFGALLYDHHSRRLAFVRSAALRRLIEALDSGRMLSQALNEAGIEPVQRERHREALKNLAARGLLVCAAGST